MARATRSTAALQQQPQHHLQKKRKRNSSPAQSNVAKLQKTDDDDDIHHQDVLHVFLPPKDAQKILDILELQDNQGLLDRVFPSSHAPDALVSLRTLLKHPTEHPLATVKASITHLRPISSLPRSRPSPAASQQLAFANLALALIEQASCGAISPPLDTDSIFESTAEDETALSRPAATDTKRKYALVQHLPQGDYWTSLSSEAATSALKQLSTGHAELVAILPSSSFTTVESVPTLGSIASRPLGPTKKSAGQRRVTTGGFLDYGPFASFAPSFDHNGEAVGQRQLAEVIYQKEQRRREREEKYWVEREGSGSITVVEEDIVMNGGTSRAGSPKPSMDLDREVNSLLPPEDIQAIKEAMGTLELENAVQELLERNQRALARLEELQWKRFSNGGANFTAVEEGSEEWETATCIMESLATLSSLRPRPSDPDTPSMVPPPSVLRKLHRSLALEPSPGWYGNLPATRITALHDDFTVKVKSSTVPPVVANTVPATPAANSATVPPAAAYASYGYNYAPASQQQGYRPATAYPTFKSGQTAGYYQTYGVPATTQQSYYNQQGYSGGSNQQPYGAATAQQPYAAYQGWYAQYQPTNAATTKTTTPTPVATTPSYGSHYNSNAMLNGAAARTPAVANTVSVNKSAGVGQPAQTAWPANYQTQGVTPTLPSHLRTNQQTSIQAATTYQTQVAGYYQAYQAQAATPTAR